MKFSISLLASSALLLGTALCADLQAGVIFAEDFSTVETGWNTRTYAYGETLFAPGASEGTPFPTRSLLLSHVSGDTTTIVSSSPAFSGASGDQDYEFNFSIRLSSNDFNAAITLWDSAKTSQAPINIKIRQNGTMEAVYFDTVTETNKFISLGSYSADTTYSFSVAFNPSDQTYSVSINGELVADTLTFGRTNQGQVIFEKLNQVMLQNYGRTAGSDNIDLYFDDLSIVSIPEPSTVAFGIAGLTALALFRRRA